MPSPSHTPDLQAVTRRALGELRRQSMAWRWPLIRERRDPLAGAERLTLTVHFEDAGDGWVMATIPEVPGAISQGRTRAEARENVIDALQTLLTPDNRLAGAPPSHDDESLTLTVS
jgi:predicted RNase H-like HicB family nuclease